MPQYTDKQKLAYFKKKSAAAKPAKGPSMFSTSRTLVKGRGDYALRKKAVDFGSAAGGQLAGSAYDTAAQALNKVSSKIKEFFGRGDYTVGDAPRRNILFPTSNTQIPQFRGGRESVTISNRAFVKDIYSSVTPNTFKQERYVINPGMVNTFPWLGNGIAANFTEYQLLGCVFEFRSMSADSVGGGNQALGSVVMATQYDVTEDPFTNKHSMEAQEFSVSGKPSNNLMCGIECATRQNVLSELYVRSGPVPEGQDPRFYDQGVHTIATNGVSGSNVLLGELWISYSVVLRKPKLENLLSQAFTYRAILDPSLITNSNPIPLNPGGTIDVQYNNMGVVTHHPNHPGHSIMLSADLPTSSLFMLVLSWKGTGVGNNTSPYAINFNGGAIAVNTFATDTDVQLRTAVIGGSSGTGVSCTVVFGIGDIPDGEQPWIEFQDVGNLLPNPITAASIKLIQLNSEAYDPNA